MSARVSFQNKDPYTFFQAHLDTVPVFSLASPREERVGVRRSQYPSSNPLTPALSPFWRGEGPEAVSSCAFYFHQSVSGLSKCSPDGRSANFSKCSGRNGSEMACSALNHLPRSTSLQRSEQNGPNFPANQSPDFLQVGHLTVRPVLFGFGSNRLEIADHLGHIVRRHATTR